jgi:hypothetical protein
MDGSSGDNIYGQEKQLLSDNYLRLNTRRKGDGSLYLNRREMKEKYDRSVLPYPLAVVKLDYCWNVLRAHIGNAVFFAMPLSFVLSYALNADIRLKGFKSKPYGYYGKTYLAVYAGLVGVFILDSLLFCEYCKPWSKLYTETTSSDYYKDMLKNRIKTEQRSNDVNYKRTRMSGLKDEEL